MTITINNGKINESFLLSLDGKTYQMVVGNMANHYGISIDEATDELINNEAENILEYLRDGIRSATSVLFQKWVLSVK
jgi:hypothetical protein